MVVKESVGIETENMLRVDIEGLPPELNLEIQQAVEASKEEAM
jgi:hypothetical protein